MLRRNAVLWIGLVLAWGALSALTWGGCLRTPLAVPFGVTTWPAKEVLLEIYGHGFGANVRVPLTPASLAAYLLWSFLLWSPLLLIAWKRVPSWLTAIVQIAVLGVVFASFWKYGNG